MFCHCFVGKPLNILFRFTFPSHNIGKKRLRFNDCLYIVGYYKDGNFKVCYQCDEYVDALKFRDSNKKFHVERLFVVCFNVKISNI